MKIITNKKMEYLNPEDNVDISTFDEIIEVVKKVLFFK
jgi:hypothetical protein